MTIEEVSTFQFTVEMVQTAGVFNQQSRFSVYFFRWESDAGG
jgi:hypothetical protein